MVFALFRVELSCLYYSLRLNGELVLQLPNPTILALTITSNPLINAEQFVETNNDVIVSLSTSFKLYLTSFIRDVDVTACFNAIRAAYFGALGKTPP